MSFHQVSILRSRISSAGANAINGYTHRLQQTYHHRHRQNSHVIRNASPLSSSAPFSSLTHAHSCRSSYYSSSVSPSLRTCVRHAPTSSNERGLLQCLRHRQGNLIIIRQSTTQLSSTDTAPVRTPPVVQLLGFGGVLPFLAGAFTTSFAPDAYMSLFARATQLYGASILSFLGGVHWGLALRHTASPSSISFVRDFTVSVTPSLVAWSATLCDPHPGLAVLSSSFVAFYVYDLFRLSPSRISPSIPPWYLPLRLPLSVAAAGGCAVAWLAIYQRGKPLEETEVEQINVATEDKGSESDR